MNKVVLVTGSSKGIGRAIIKEFSKNVCRELVDKVVIYSKNKFDFYLKGYTDPFNFNYEGNILYSQH